MSGEQLDRIVRRAIAAGLLPASAQPPQQDSRPWPIVLLTALGAWLAAVPLLGVVGLLLGDLISLGAGPYVLAPLMLAAAVVVLRSRGVPLFVEQLAVPALLVGGGTLAFGLFRDLPLQAGAAVLASVAVLVAALLPRPWLRVLLGAAAAVLAVVACLPGRWSLFDRGGAASQWVGWHLIVAAWLAAVRVQSRALGDGRRARIAAALESLSVGWVLAALAGLAWWSGTSFLVGASAGGVAGEVGSRAAAAWHAPALQAASAALALAAAAWLAFAWPGVRQLWTAGVAAVLIALAAFMPALGAVLFVLAGCAASHRWRLAAAAALSAAWIVGSFYYHLGWPLATKAAVLVGAGALLGLLAWLAPPGEPAAKRVAALPATLRTKAGIVLAALAVLATVNIGILQKERLIADGEPVFVELAPVDPRSLMQGDYMQLNFQLGAVSSRLDGLLSADRPRVVARRDAQGIATVARLDDGTPLASDEIRIELTPKNGRWTLVSDAWFFKEGEADRWARARYGEFRVDESGKALLVGLRGQGLEVL
ncbi:GDYXXLXY domain-containing protein [Piscinibacter sp.]|uniref:GDYXXLXY domain-containing protein n=1 Tax=Piscinibacter sp. TaxID=1903157 RepID=UPI002C34D43C|nr:GDYXXLXY domain-containing protein [Albitalea sp.]HUG24536.1 GDYXXLXY domain-containing protein [Albitalea sp.]